jgi:hypothetical protein
LKRVCEAIPEETKQKKLPTPQNETSPVFAELTQTDQHTVRDAAITVRFGSAEMVIHNDAEPSVIEAALRALSRKC